MVKSKLARKDYSNFDRIFKQLEPLNENQLGLVAQRLRADLGGAAPTARGIKESLRASRGAGRQEPPAGVAPPTPQPKPAPAASQGPHEFAPDDAVREWHSSREVSQTMKDQTSGWDENRRLSVLS
jgi:hypothetical protein